MERKKRCKGVMTQGISFGLDWFNQYVWYFTCWGIHALFGGRDLELQYVWFCLFLFSCCCLYRLIKFVTIFMTFSILSYFQHLIWVMWNWHVSMVRKVWRYNETWLEGHWLKYYHLISLLLCKSCDIGINFESFSWAMREKDSERELSNILYIICDLNE